jgi:hypothetical protein
MYNISMNFKELQESTNENLNRHKLDKEIIDRKAERDWFKNECNKLDFKCHEKQRKFTKLKNKHNELDQEKRFIEEQII